jgi:anti-anti-sigma regulatory factor
LKKVESKDQTRCFRIGSSKSPNLTRISVLSEEKLPTHIIIDCSMFSYVDTAGANAIKKIVNKYQGIGVLIFLSGCAFHVESLLSKVGFFIEVPFNQVFKTIHDAVTYIKCGIVEEYQEKRISFNKYDFPKSVVFETTRL